MFVPGRRILCGVELEAGRVRVGGGSKSYEDRIMTIIVIIIIIIIIIILI